MEKIMPLGTNRLEANMRYLVGIDEVGRGPIAGPVAVGICVVPFEHKDFIFDRIFRGVRDSKQLSEKARESWLEIIRSEERSGRLSVRVSFVGNEIIDERGISYAIKTAIRRALKRLNLSGSECLVLLDGGLKAPERFLYQRTIIKGDETEPVISIASIAAKVSRDKKMKLLAKKYPGFLFERHKGYGTRAHYEAIKAYETCPIHRASFLKRLFKG